ncbi:hypothetical protein MMC30_003546 [Trapelia coarctata]|nr:hypothetical protein [Trapelia coarctata]
MIITVSGTKPNKRSCQPKVFKFVDALETQPGIKPERAEWAIKVSEGIITIEIRDQIFQIPGAICSITASENEYMPSTIDSHQPGRQNRLQTKNFRIRGLARHLTMRRTNHLQAPSPKNENRNVQRRWWRPHDPLRNFTVARNTLGLAADVVRRWAEATSQAGTLDSESSTTGPVTPTEPQYETIMKSVEDLLDEYRTPMKTEEGALEPFHPLQSPQYAHLLSYGAVPALLSDPFVEHLKGQSRT